MWDRHSLRYRVPLNLAAAILFTALVMGTALSWRAYGDSRDDLFEDSVDIASAMSATLLAALKHDDPWQAYGVLRTVRSDDPDTARTLVLLDRDARVFVSSHPREYPMGTGLSGLDPGAAAFLGAAQGGPAVHDAPAGGGFRVAVPFREDDALRGTLLLLYPESVFRRALRRIANQVAIATLVALATLIPVAWWLGKRTVAPLVDLAGRMEALGRTPARQVPRAGAAGHDEIGQLSRRFNALLDELDEKERLERQVIVSERLAALGRVVAGVAHEVNNPLGGMLNAINTYRRFGQPDERTAKTIALLERGLHQIRETVSALLVEARAGRHGLSPHDVEDVRTLVQPDATRRRVRLAWENRLEHTLAIPATPVRQMLINLALNAVEATPEGGQMTLHAGTEGGALSILVANEGDAIPREEMGRLFEPFATGHAGGHGLGLWVTYQIVDQLGGEIVVGHEEGVTSFAIRLPLEEAA